METIAWRCRSTTPEREVLTPPSMFVAEFSRTVRRRAYFGANAAHLDRGFGGVIDMLGRLSDSAASSSPALQCSSIRGLTTGKIVAPVQSRRFAGPSTLFNASNIGRP